MIRTEEEQKAYLYGFEACVKCVEKYLSDENRMRLEWVLSAMKNAVSIEWDEESEE